MSLTGGSTGRQGEHHVTRTNWHHRSGNCPFAENLTVGISLGALMVTLIVQSEKRLVQRIDRLEDHTTQRFEQMQGETNRRFDQMQAEMNLRFEQMQAEINRRFEQMQAEINRRFEQMQAEMNRRFDAQDERIRGLEQGQSNLAGQFSILKDFFTHQPNTE